MTNPVIHALVVIAAIIIPGGLLVYFAWLTGRRRRREKDIPQIDSMDVEEAREAFRKMFPKRSLRDESRKNRLMRAKVFRHRKSEK